MEVHSTCLPCQPQLPITLATIEESAPTLHLTKTQTLFQALQYEAAPSKSCTYSTLMATLEQIVQIHSNALKLQLKQQGHRGMSITIAEGPGVCIFD